MCSMQWSNKKRILRTGVILMYKACAMTAGGSDVGAVW